MSKGAATVIPSHVDPAKVYVFDIYNDARLLEDVHLGYRALQLEAPEIFYTPMNGGHWMVTRFDLIEKIMRDPANFSNKEIEIPKTESPFMAIPINLDPPEHTPYRMMLMKHFTARTVASLEPTMDHWAKRLIDEVADKGWCDFAQLGALYPVTVFMEFAGLPLDRYVEFRELVTEFFSHIPRERRIELQAKIFSELEAVFRARMVDPKDDLFGRLVVETVNDRPLTMDELLSIGFLLFVAGLDTVANAMTFGFNFLARRPDIQDRLLKNPEAIPNYIDEAMRRFAVTNGVRLVRNDIEFGGVMLKAGDMIVAPMTLAGMDDRRNPDPEAFEIDRPKRQHISFSTGPHLCLGHLMAKAEMRVFITEFLRRVPRFRVADNFVPHWRAGVVMSLEALPLEWDTQAVGSAA